MNTSSKTRGAESTKHTPGPYENTGVTLFAGVNAVSRTTEIVHTCTLNDKLPTEEELANGRLVEEAFVVAAETGFTPRELAEQHAEMLAMLKEISPDLAWGTTGRWKGGKPDYLRLEALIAKAEGHS